MTDTTDLRERDLEQDLRELLQERALTIAGPAPGLDASEGHLMTAARPVGPQPSGPRRRVAIGVAAAILAACATGIALSRPADDDTEAISTVATEPGQPAQAAPGETHVLIINGSRWEGDATIDIVTDGLTDLGIGELTGETTPDLASSAVYYRPGFEAVASQVAFQAHLTGRETPLPADRASVDADIVVELGQDWDPIALDEVRGEPSNLPYVPATVSDSLQLSGTAPWPGPANDGDPAETPEAAVRSFLARVVGTRAAEEASVQELFQFPVEGGTLGRVRVTFSGGATTEAHVGRADGQENWTVSVMVSTSGNDDPWGGRSGAMPLEPGSDDAATEKRIAYPDGAVSARIWYRHEQGPTLTVELDQAALEAGYRTALDGYPVLEAAEEKIPVHVGSDRVSLGSTVLLRGSLTSNVAIAAAYYDEQGEPITVFLSSY